MRHWGILEVHAGAQGKDSKSEILFCAAPPHVYSDSAAYDGADLSDVQLPAGRSMPVVSKFKYLGDYVTTDCTDTFAVGGCGSQRRARPLARCASASSHPRPRHAGRQDGGLRGAHPLHAPLRVAPTPTR